MQNPNLHPLRRVLLPIAEKTWPKGYFVAEADVETEFVGVLPTDVNVAKREIRTLENVYPNNLASLQYTTVNEEKVWSEGSYAHRPMGFFGTWQTHFRLFPHEKGTAIIAHHEVAPIPWPEIHYAGTTQDDGEGITLGRQILSDLSLRTDCSPDGITSNENSQRFAR